MPNKSWDYIIVGAGIQGLTLALYLKEKYFEKKILLIDGSHIEPCCSSSSTALVSVAGVEQGVGELGEYLLDGHREFVKFVDKFEVPCVESANEFIIKTHKNSQNFKRFGIEHSDIGIYGRGELLPNAQSKCFVIHSEQFVNSLKDILKSMGVEVLKSVVTDYSDNLITLDNLKELEFNELFLCHGASELLSKTKNVPGTYLEWDNVDLPLPSFAIRDDGQNIIYRKNAKCLTLGSDNRKKLSELYLGDLDALIELRDKFKAVVSDAIFSQLTIGTAKLKSGNRVKGKQRKPYFKRTGKVVEFNGLYKNGFLYSFTNASRFVKSLP